MIPSRALKDWIHSEKMRNCADSMQVLHPPTPESSLFSVLIPYRHLEEQFYRGSCLWQNCLSFLCKPQYAAAKLKPRSQHSHGVTMLPPPAERGSKPCVFRGRTEVCCSLWSHKRDSALTKQLGSSAVNKEQR